MSSLASIPAWLPVSPYQAAEIAANAASESTCAADATPESTPSSPSCSSPSATPPSSSPDSPFATPHSPPSSPFPDCDRLADTLLAEIAAGTQCLAAIAAQHHIPYPRFTLWLLQPATQERLAALSVAIASAARLTATAALPDIVRGLKTTVDQLQSQTHMTIAPAGGPGADHLRAESVILRRHRALISAASLIYRISRFTCPGQYPVRPRSPGPDGGAVERSETEGVFESSTSSRRAALRGLPRLNLPAIDFPDLDPRSARESAPCHRDRPSEGDLGASPLVPDSAAAAPLPSRNPEPERGGRNPIPDFTSDFPHPTSNITPISVDDALHMLAAEYDLSAEEVAELRNDSHSWIHDFIPPSAAATSATLSARLTADDG